MERLGLDDTLHAVVQVTHEHGLPLRGVHVDPGRVQVFTDEVDLPRWVRWLTDPATTDARCTVWHKAATVAFHVRGRREGIEWCVTASFPAGLATAVLAEHGVTVTKEHLRVAAEAAVALVASTAMDEAVAHTGRGAS